MVDVERQQPVGRGDLQREGLEAAQQQQQPQRRRRPSDRPGDKQLELGQVGAVPRAIDVR
jgi:hypothetical protein